MIKSVKIYFATYKELPNHSYEITILSHSKFYHLQMLTQNLYSLTCNYWSELKTASFGKLKSGKPKLVVAEQKSNIRFLIPRPMFFKTLSSRVVIHYLEGLNWSR